MRSQRPLETTQPATRHGRQRGLLPLLAVALTAIVLTLAEFRWSAANSTGLGQSPVPTPTLDRLATPVMPAAPTPFDLGRQVYYTNCMPCHGDRGQGLTDEWRAVWVEDHQNCWARGCHGNHQGDEGYPLPRSIPPVIGPPTVLARFQTSADLYEYLHDTHPPQRPGALADADYRNVTVFLWQANGRLNPASDQSTVGTLLPVVIGILLLVPVIFFIIKRPRRKQTD